MRPGSTQWCVINRTRSNDLKPEHINFCTNMQKNFFVVRVMKHWNWLPREAVEVFFYGDTEDPS